MNLEKYGFVYLWRDKKNNLYYIGCHWGNVSDGYVCSSSWMKKAYKNRPEDFRRRILKTGIKDRPDMFKEEQRYLEMIKPEEKKTRYYNLNFGNRNPWHQYEDRRLTVGQKISVALTGRLNKPCTQEHKAKISAANSGKKHTQETKEKISSKKTGVKHGAYSPEHKLAISIGQTGMKHSSARRAANARGHVGKTMSLETKLAMSAAQIGRTWCHDPITKQNKRLKIVPEGWVHGIFKPGK